MKCPHRFKYKEAYYTGFPVKCRYCGAKLVELKDHYGEDGCCLVCEEQICRDGKWCDKCLCMVCIRRLYDWYTKRYQCYSAKTHVWRNREEDITAKEEEKTTMFGISVKGGEE